MRCRPAALTTTRRKRDRIPPSHDCGDKGFSVNADLLAALRDLEEAVVTNVIVSEHRARIVFATDGGSRSLTLIGCEWSDERCRSCSCDRSRVRVIVE